MLRIGIVTRHDDLHAYVVQKILEERDIMCSLLFADSLSCVGGISWFSALPVQNAERSSLVDSNGRDVVVGDLHLIWWRRLTGEPRVPVKLPEDARTLVANDCQAALLGMLLTDFRGVWISAPDATRRASNKLLQLRVAQQAGLNVPRTLVSQEPGVVRSFCESVSGLVVVKPVAGAPDTPVMTGVVTPETLTDDEIRISPATYQQYIPGTRHLRISCFGDILIAALLETETLDWRYPLDAHVTPFELDGDTASRVRRVLKDLGLRMGMVDMKLNEAGTPVWLEINPQGQFMFLEGMCSSLRLSRPFCAFLTEEAERASRAMIRDRPE